MNLTVPYFKGRLIRDKDGSPINHRIWFKVLLNPILRTFGYVIVTHLNEQEDVTGYSLKTYPLIKPVRLNKRELKRQREHIDAEYNLALNEHEINLMCDIKSIKSKRKKLKAKKIDPATADRGWDIPPMFPHSNFPTPQDGEGTPSVIQNVTPTLFL